MELGDGITNSRLAGAFTNPWAGAYSPGAPMNSSECRSYAEQCSRLTEKSAAVHREILLDLADKWLTAADELAALDHTKSGRAG
jgi:hypothetical protein